MTESLEQKLPMSSLTEKQQKCYICTKTLKGVNPNCISYRIGKKENPDMERCLWYEVIDYDVTMIAMGQLHRTTFPTLAKTLYDEFVK